MTENSSGKRPLEHDDEDRSSKRSAINSDTVFRLLVESKKVGSVIGKAGSVIKSLREETGAKIKVLDAVMGCDERVIMISGVDDPAAPFSTAQDALWDIIVFERKSSRHNNRAHPTGIPPGHHNPHLFNTIVTISFPDLNSGYKYGIRDFNKITHNAFACITHSTFQSLAEADQQTDETREALFRTHQRLCDGDVEAGIVVETVTTKMLVYGSQAGCLIGKGGEIIKV
eukprot:1179183-Prorocentrum_minimum.AAC.9